MYILVFVTAKDEKQAEKIAVRLLENRLAACVNIVSGVTSLFRWQGKIQKEKEALLLIKTKTGAFARLKAAVKKAHNYEVPEIIAIKISKGEEKYLRWVKDCVI